MVTPVARATVELPPQRFQATARTEVEAALAQLTKASSPLPGRTETIVMVRDEATLDELRTAQKELTEAIGDLDDRADDLEARRSDLADAMDAARSAASIASARSDRRASRSSARSS